MATTFLQLKDYARDLGYGDDTDEGVRGLETMINDVFREVHESYNWSFLKKRGAHALKAPYETGTVSVNHNDTAVTGSGTTFVASHVGGYIVFDAANGIYKVTAVGGATSLTIDQAYIHPEGTNLSAGTYSIVFPVYDHPSDFRQMTEPTEGDWLWDMEPISEETWMKEFRTTGSETGWARAYADTGDEILFTPAPADQQLVQFWYYYVPTELTSDGQNIDWPDKYMKVMRDGIRSRIGKISDAEFQRTMRRAYSSSMPSLQARTKLPEGQSGSYRRWSPIARITST